MQGIETFLIELLLKRTFSPCAESFSPLEVTLLFALLFIGEFFVLFVTKRGLVTSTFNIPVKVFRGQEYFSFISYANQLLGEYRLEYWENTNYIPDMNISNRAFIFQLKHITFLKLIFLS
jgi:hypothetical protein